MLFYIDYNVGGYLCQWCECSDFTISEMLFDCNRDNKTNAEWKNYG